MTYLPCVKINCQYTRPRTKHQILLYLEWAVSKNLGLFNRNFIDKVAIDIGTFKSNIMIKHDLGKSSPL